MLLVANKKQEYEVVSINHNTDTIVHSGIVAKYNEAKRWKDILDNIQHFSWIEYQIIEIVQASQ